MIFGWLDNDTLALLAMGVKFTIGLTVITSIASMLLGLTLGTLRLSRKRWHWAVSGLFVELHRNVPALVLILFWAFAIPNLFPQALRQPLFFDNWFVNTLKQWTGLPLPYYGLAAMLALTLNTSAYIAELFRAGVGTIPQEHVDGARTLGATTWEIYRKILVPNGLRVAMPAISTRLIHNMKNTSLATFVAVPELFHNVQAAITISFRAVELLIVAAVLYLVLSLCFSQSLQWVEQRL